MGWDCNGGDVSAGVLCRALRRAARAPPSTQRVAFYLESPRYSPASAARASAASRLAGPATPQTSEAAASFSWPGIFSHPPCVSITETAHVLEDHNCALTIAYCQNQGET